MQQVSHTLDEVRARFLHDKIVALGMAPTKEMRERKAKRGLSCTENEVMIQSIGI